MKPVARLTGTILARKGFAAPSTGLLPEPGDLDHIVDRDPYIGFGVPEPMAETDRREMGQRHPIQSGSSLSGPSIEPSTPVAHAEPAVKNAQKRAPDKAHRVAMTVRMDEEQHTKLKIYCAHRHTSAQKIIMEAIGDYMSRHANNGELDGSNFLKDRLEG